MSAKRDAFDKAIVAWKAGDLNGYLQLYDENIRLHGYSAEPMTKTDVRGFYEDLWASLSDIELVIHETVEDADRLSCRFVMRATPPENSPERRPRDERSSRTA